MLLAERCGFVPDAWQADVLRSKAKQLALCCSRQAGKSTVTALLALHTAIYAPGALVLLIAPALRQSQEIFLKLRQSFNELNLKTEYVTAESALRIEFENGSRIVALPGATERTIRGYSSVSLLVIDEAARVTDELYSAVRPMLAISKGRIVLCSTPFGRRGFFYEAFMNGGPEWERVRVTAHDCPRIDAEWLEAERLAIGRLWFASEYLCEFVDTVDTVFSTDDIERALTSDLHAPAWWS